MTLTLVAKDGQKLIFPVPHGVSSKKVVRALSRVNVTGNAASFFDLSPKEKRFAHEILGALKEHKAEAKKGPIRRLWERVRS